MCISDIRLFFDASHVTRRSNLQNIDLRNTYLIVSKIYNVSNIFFTGYKIFKSPRPQKIYLQ